MYKELAVDQEVEQVVGWWSASLGKMLKPPECECMNVRLKARRDRQRYVCVCVNG